MPSVTIDAGVLAAPPPDSDRSTVLEYVETLLDWRQLLEEPWVAIYMSERVAEVLDGDGLYPLRHALRQVFSRTGIVEYDVNTVAMVGENLLRLTPHFETIFKIRDVLCETPETDPDLLSITTHRHMASELARCVVLFALLREHCRHPIADHALVVRPWHGRTQVRVRAIIHDLEHERDDMSPLPKPPDYFQGSVWVCQSFRELVTGISEASIWQTAKDEAGYEIAANIALYKSRLERGLEPEWGEGSSFRFGPRFITRANQCFQSSPTSLIERSLRAMVETIDRLRMEDVHALRQSDSGGAPQRVRGKDKGWRRDIDREFHLHYWEGAAGIEFGWIGPHNDFQLPE
jgi:hypothetical protein